jgi:hypothetical protein
MKSKCKKQQGSSAMSKRPQEQIQMITMVIGRATPNVPPIINANADSRFASACTSCLDMPLLHRATAPWARWMCVVNKRLTGRRKPLLHDTEAAPCLYLTFPIFLRGLLALSWCHAVRILRRRDADPRQHDVAPRAATSISASIAACHAGASWPFLGSLAM